MNHLDKNPTVPCTICERPTPMLGTKLCDPCWEIARRIQHANPKQLAWIRSEVLPDLTAQRDRLVAALDSALYGHLDQPNALKLLAEVRGEK